MNSYKSKKSVQNKMKRVKTKAISAFYSWLCTLKFYKKDSSKSVNLGRQAGTVEIKIFF